MHIETIAFDLYGTLLDVSGLAAAMEPLAGEGAAELLARWRTAQLERTWALNRTNSYQPFDQVTADALAQVAPQLDAGTREKLCALWLTPPAFPDAKEALHTLAHAKKKAVVLSNGTPEMIRAALAAADLTVDAIFSADEVKAYKTEPRVYALVPKESTLFVSGNGWDAAGAKRAGMQVAWLDRGAAAPDPTPDLVMHSLQELSLHIAQREHGVRVVPAHLLDPNTAQTPGMSRAAAINFARVGAEKLWAGTVVIHPNARTGAHHHGPVESVIYVVRGKARMRWGERLQYTAEAGPGDFIYVPPFVPHQEINGSRDEPLECVLVRSGQEPVVVNLEIAPAEPPENVEWIDDLHRHA